MLTCDWTYGSLFTGIGGIDLGLESVGMRPLWQSEIDPYCCRVLAKHWPDTPNLGDVTTIDWSTVERPDAICGGYPCQPFSLAGRRQGEADARHLWPHMARAIRELRPRYAILENVPGHRSLGFGDVLRDLAESGYDAEWDCIPALAVGAPHWRDRVFIVAYPQCDPVRPEPLGIFGRLGASLPWHDGRNGPMADTDREREPQPGGPVSQERGWAGNGGEPLADADGEGPQERRPGWAAHDCDHWSAEPDVGRVAHGIPARVDQLRALGNAVVPQVAGHVARCLIAADHA